jgi:hypothetical protein
MPGNNEVKNKGGKDDTVIGKFFLWPGKPKPKIGIRREEIADNINNETKKDGENVFTLKRFENGLKQLVSDIDGPHPMTINNNSVKPQLMHEKNSKLDKLKEILKGEKFSYEEINALDEYYQQPVQGEVLMTLFSKVLPYCIINRRESNVLIDMYRRKDDQGKENVYIYTKMITVAVNFHVKNASGLQRINRDNLIKRPLGEALKMIIVLPVGCSCRYKLNLSENPEEQGFFLDAMMTQEHSAENFENFEDAQLKFEFAPDVQKKSIGVQINENAFLDMVEKVSLIVYSQEKITDDALMDLKKQELVCADLTFKYVIKSLKKEIEEQKKKKLKYNSVDIKNEATKPDENKIIENKIEKLNNYIARRSNFIQLAKNVNFIKHSSCPVM